MAYDRSFFRLTFGGRIAGGADIWVCGLNFAKRVDPQVDLDWGLWHLDVVYQQLSNAYVASGISTGAVLEWCKIALVGQDGNYMRDPEDYVGAARPGNVATLASSPQDAFVVTLWSGMTTGKANYGRFYLPWSGHTVDRTTAKVGQAEISTMLNAWHDAILSIVLSLGTDAGEPTLHLFNMSQVGPSKEVKFLRIGDVVDTQRRRRNAINETYQQLDLD